jgi:O-antigen biosynthesis protein WbqP
MYKKYIKRLIDVVLSLAGMILASWLYIIIIIAIKIDDHGPIFFIQTRIGINKKEFKLIKFRSMKITAPHDRATRLLENPEQHITRVGKFLRKTSLDEIPQLWNIFVGDMSVIGPRPVICNENDLINERDKYGANDVKPGLSGWAQVNGRDLLGFEEKAMLDGEYVEKMSFIFDCRCFLATAVVALRRINVVEGAPVKMNKVNQISQIKQINKIEEKNSGEEMIV